MVVRYTHQSQIKGIKCSSLNALSIMLQTQSLVKIGSRKKLEEVTLSCRQRQNFLPVQYDLEVCPLNISDPEFTGPYHKQVFYQVFKTNVIDTVKLCQGYFDFDLPSIVIENREKHSWGVLLPL